MADSQDDILAEFSEFLAAKEEAKRAESQDEDEEIEVYNSDGKGVRARRSRFKASILEELGLGRDPEPGSTDGDKSDTSKSKTGSKSSSSRSTTAGAKTITRKYFAGKGKP